MTESAACSSQSDRALRASSAAHGGRVGGRHRARLRRELAPPARAPRRGRRGTPRPAAGSELEARDSAPTSPGRGRPRRSRPYDDRRRGSTVAGPMRAGEVITDRRIVSARWSAAGGGHARGTRCASPTPMSSPAARSATGSTSTPPPASGRTAPLCCVTLSSSASRQPDRRRRERGCPRRARRRAPGSGPARPGRRPARPVGHVLRLRNGHLVGVSSSSSCDTSPGPTDQSAPYRTKDARPVRPKGFKDFVLRGNLVELAVAFIMATAFASS